MSPDVPAGVMRNGVSRLNPVAVLAGAETLTGCQEFSSFGVVLYQRVVSSSGKKPLVVPWSVFSSM